MSVRIPISADPSGTISAWDQITAAIRRAGQEGRRFEQLDFSHPELKQLEADLRKIQQNFEELNKAGRGATANHVREEGYTDVLDWHRRQPTYTPPPDVGAKVPGRAPASERANVDQYVMQGTRYGRSASRRGASVPIPGVGKFIKGALALAGIGGLASLAHQGVEAAGSEAIQMDFFKRAINDTSDSFDQLRSRIEKAGEGLQLTYQETVKLAQGFAHASALQSGAAIARGVNLSAGFGRSFGLEPGMSGGIFGSMRFRGITGPGGVMDPKQFALMLADAISSSGMYGKSSEVMQAIAHYVTSSERVMVNAPNVAGYTDLLTRMNIAGKNGMPGLRGEMGAALIGQVDAAIRAGGRMGAAGRNILWRGINAHGQQLNPFQTDWLLAGGAFATRAHAFGRVAPGLAHGHQTVLDSFLDEMRHRMAGRGQFALYEGTANVLGIGIRQAQALLKLQHMGHGNMGKIGSLLKSAGLTYKDLNATGLKELGQIAYATPDQLQGLKTQFLARGDLSKQEKDLIRSAQGPEALRTELAKAAAHHGRVKNVGTETLQATVDVKNAITDLGKTLLKPINDIKKYVAEMVGGGANMIKDSENALFATGKTREKAQKNIKGFLGYMGHKVFRAMLDNFLDDKEMRKYDNWYAREQQGLNKPVPTSAGGDKAAGGKFEFDHHITLHDHSGAVVGKINRQMTLEAPVGQHG